jgi:hypothetical protein
MASHREQRRLVLLKGHYRLGEAWHAATICNVSNRGLMVKSASPAPKGARVELRHNGFSISGEVAWSLGERFGVRVPGPVDLSALQGASPEFGVGRRSLPRMAVRIAGEFVLRENAFTVLLIDISQSGARIHMPIPPCAGLRGLLRWGDNERDCTVLWATRDVFGVAFDELLPTKEVVGARTARRKLAQAQPVWSNPQIPAHLHSAIPFERRERGRAQLSLDCEIRQDDEPWLSARLENVSQDGFRLAWFPGCRLSEPLSLRLPDGQIFEAAILWRDEHMIACKFAEQVTAGVLERIAVR